MKIVDKKPEEKRIRRTAMVYGEVYRSCSSGMLYIAARVDGLLKAVCLSSGDALSMATADCCWFEHVEAEVVVK